MESNVVFMYTVQTAHFDELEAASNVQIKWIWHNTSDQMETSPVITQTTVKHDEFMRMH